MRMRIFNSIYRYCSLQVKIDHLYTVLHKREQQISDIIKVLASGDDISIQRMIREAKIMRDLTQNSKSKKRFYIKVEEDKGEQE